MTRDEVLRELREKRAEFDRLLEQIPGARLAEKCPGGEHSPRDIVCHVAAYDDLMVKRLRCAADGKSTAFDRDQTGWEVFNERVWAEAVALDTETVLVRAAETFLDLLDEVNLLSDEDLESTEPLTGLAQHIDPGWLKGHALCELIGTDGFEHYPMHYAQLAAAAAYVS